MAVFIALRVNYPLSFNYCACSVTRIIQSIQTSVPACTSVDMKVFRFFLNLLAPAINSWCFSNFGVIFVCLEAKASAHSFLLLLPLHLVLPLTINLHFFLQMIDSLVVFGFADTARQKSLHLSSFQFYFNTLTMRTLRTIKNSCHLWSRCFLNHIS